MDLKLIEIFTKIIDNKYKVNKHKKYYSNEYYLKNIFLMLNDINKWIVHLQMAIWLCQKTLIKLKSYEPVLINNKIAKSHFDTIRKKFVKWVNDGIFKLAFDECMNLKNINKNVELIIDSTFINNKYGSKNHIKLY